jgi:hypothetical protein
MVIKAEAGDIDPLSLTTETMSVDANTDDEQPSQEKILQAIREVHLPSAMKEAADKVASHLPVEQRRKFVTRLVNHLLVSFGLLSTAPNQDEVVIKAEKAGI